MAPDPTLAAQGWRVSALDGSRTPRGASAPCAVNDSRPGYAAVVKPPQEPTTERLSAEQAAREQEERRRAERATTVAEERSADRRADKAAYLKEKLDEQVAREEPR